MTIRQMVGDCRETLATLEPSSVQACVTSPPYWGLRDYGTPPLVWGGVAHEHDWQFRTIRGQQPNVSASSTLHDSPPKRNDVVRPYVFSTGFCRCTAWLGSLGLEPTPELYVEHIVECFRHVRRVLRDDGTLWVNLGDSYAGSGKGPSNSVQSDASQIGPSAIKKRNPAQFANGQAPTSWLSVPAGVKPKDLLMVPFRVAMALQADGWWLRSVIPWLKRNSMPESVTDRPSTAVEYIFMFSKSGRYFYDADAIRADFADERLGNPGLYRKTGSAERKAVNERGDLGFLNGGGGWNTNGAKTGRNRRNSDWWFESWQGLLLDESDDPLAFIVNPQPLKLAHFATFPPKLVEPMVKASTRPGDVILDPFGGAGTVGLVADRLGRNAVLVDLKPEYSAMAVDRLTGDAPMFVQVTEAPA